MDLPPSRSRSQSPVQVIKNQVLTDDELLLMLENDKLFSCEEEFVEDSDNDDYGLLAQCQCNDGQ